MSIKWCLCVDLYSEQTSTDMFFLLYCSIEYDTFYIHRMFTAARLVIWSFLLAFGNLTRKCQIWRLRQWNDKADDVGCGGSVRRDVWQQFINEAVQQRQHVRRVMLSSQICSSLLFVCQCSSVIHICLSLPFCVVCQCITAVIYVCLPLPFCLIQAHLVNDLTHLSEAAMAL